MKTPEFSLDSLRKNRKKNKRNLPYEHFSAHYFLKLPIFVILVIVFSLNAFIYVLIRFFIYFFENVSFFIITKYIDFTRYVSRKGRSETRERRGKSETDESIFKINRLMKSCNNYHDYVRYAYRMDVLTGKTVHINENDDYINIYDVNLLKKTSQSIRNHLHNRDVLPLLEDIKVATSPRIKGIFQEKYYCKTYSTPHIILTDFISNVMCGLDFIENYVNEQKEKNFNYLFSDEYLILKKYFKDIFRQWGNTALFLSGGAILGLHHFGVIEAFLKASINDDYFSSFGDDLTKGEKHNDAHEGVVHSPIQEKENFATYHGVNNSNREGVNNRSTLEDGGRSFLRETPRSDKKKCKNKLEKIKKFFLNRASSKESEPYVYGPLSGESVDSVSSGGDSARDSIESAIRPGSHISSRIDSRIGSRIGSHISSYIRSDGEIVGDYLASEGNASFANGEKCTRSSKIDEKNTFRNNSNDFVENFEDNVLPQIICGTSAGSIIAAWVCSRTNEELFREFNIGFIYKIVSCFSSENWFYSFFNIYKKGNFYDIDKIVKLIYDLYGDMTFLEAFIKTNLVLNITVTRAESGNNNFTCDEDGHLVLNYMNSPNVLIYTAVLASCSFPYLLQPFKLLEKKYNKENVYRFMSIKKVYNTKFILNSNSAFNQKIYLKGEMDSFFGKEAENAEGSSEQNDEEHIERKDSQTNIDFTKSENDNNVYHMNESNLTESYKKKNSSCEISNIHIKEEHMLNKKGTVKKFIGQSLNKVGEELLSTIYESEEMNEEMKKKEFCEKARKKKKNKNKNNNNNNNNNNMASLWKNHFTRSEKKKSETSECANSQRDHFKGRTASTGGNGKSEEVDAVSTTKRKKESECKDFSKKGNTDLLNEEYTIINSVQFKNMYFHDGSLKSDIPAHNLNQILSVKYKIVSQVNPHVFPFTGVRVHGEAGKPVKWRGNSGHWRAGFLMSSMEILFKENMRYILRLMALLDLSPTIRGLNAGSIAMQNYNGDITLHPKRLYMKHFKLISVSNYDDVEWYIQQGRQMTFQKLPLILNRMKIEKKLIKMKKSFF
ncbi:patatin-like phospholipase, putative [Plasmodium ovale]|uniref:Patatin-like phospholipase, putative n=1 Tax=Plasmodium ovale TaxID=36330 RepID=A0A1D3U7W6_PLAOA|nr:patatin-like phospholipase, putative [Plasmodium ovale]